MNESRDAWKKYGSFDNNSCNFEFFPEHFMKLLQYKLQFQEMMIHTQLFIGYIEEKKEESMRVKDSKNGTEAMFIATWLQYRWMKWKESENRVKHVMNIESLQLGI